MEAAQTIVTEGREISDHKQAAWYVFGNAITFHESLIDVKPFQYQ